jgi:hypothetical protein
VGVDLGCLCVCVAEELLNRAKRLARGRKARGEDTIAPPEFALPEPPVERARATSQRVAA